MSDPQNFAFGQFVPGFDFLQNLAKGASDAMPQMPNLSSWVAPTLNVEDLERRISELRAVHFWLEQNSRALAATVQALEVQKMTLATLKGMNLSMAELASAMQIKPSMDTGAAAPSPAPASAPAQAPEPPAASEPASPRAGAEAAAKPTGPSTSTVIDPLQWWGALTQQFQSIASAALQEAAQQPGSEAVRSMADAAAQAMKTATRMTDPAPAGTPAAKAPVRKSTAGKSQAGQSSPRKAPAPKPGTEGAAPKKAARKTAARNRT